MSFLHFGHFCKNRISKNSQNLEILQILISASFEILKKMQNAIFGKNTKNDQNQFLRFW